MVRFLYRTDGGVAPDGFFADEIVVTADGEPVVTSGAEDSDEGWTLDGFVSTTGTETGDFANYYVAPNRTYESYDKYLRPGPYNSGRADTKPDWVDHLTVPTGLLLPYWDPPHRPHNPH